jgi:hypothetical protein
MVGPEQQMLRTEHLVATGKRLVVIAHGVNIKVGEVVAGRSRRFGPMVLEEVNRRLPTLRLAGNTALEFPPSISMRGPCSLKVEW